MPVDAKRLDKPSTYVNMMAVKQVPPPPTCCGPFVTKRLPRAMARRLATSFQALSDPARLTLLHLIQAQPGEEACVCNLVDPLGLAQPTVTHHLQVLHRAGLLCREKRGVWVYYRVERRGFEALRCALDLLAAPPSPVEVQQARGDVPREEPSAGRRALSARRTTRRTPPSSKPRRRGSGPSAPPSGS